MTRAVALLLALALVAGCAAPARVPEPAPAVALALRAPKRAAAGAPVVVVAEWADAPEGLAALLVAQSGYGPRLYRARFQAGRAEFALPPEDVRTAGLLSLTVRAGAATGRAELTIAPGPPVGPVTPLVGPRSLIADGRHWGTAVAIPFDAYGNPVAEGTRVEFRVQRPDGRSETLRTTAAGLVAWRRFTSATRAGRTTFVAAAGAARGPEASLVETPGRPAALPLSAGPAGLPADGRRLMTLRAGPIIDRFGNQMLDGTLVTFVAEAPGALPRLIPAYTIDGVAQAQLQAPAGQAALTVRATLYGVESKPLRVAFEPGPAVGRVPVRVSVDRNSGTVSVVAGPLLGALGQFVPEGTPVAFTIVGPEAMLLRLEGAAEDGRAEVRLRLAELPVGAYHVEAEAGASGGASFTVP